MISSTKQISKRGRRTTLRALIKRYRTYATKIIVVRVILRAHSTSKTLLNIKENCPLIISLFYQQMLSEVIFMYIRPRIPQVGMSLKFIATRIILIKHHLLLQNRKLVRLTMQMALNQL